MSEGTFVHIDPVVEFLNTEGWRYTLYARDGDEVLFTLYNGWRCIESSRMSLPMAQKLVREYDDNLTPTQAQVLGLAE